MTNEPIEKGKRKRTRKRVRDLEAMHRDSNHEVPGHVALADGYRDGMHQEQPDECKSAADMASPAERARGGNPASVQDFNSQRSGNGSGRVAVGSRDLQNQPSVFQGILSSLRTNSTTFVGQGGFHSEFAGSDSPEGAPGNHVQVREWDPAGVTGVYAGMMPVDCSPRGDDGYGQHRDSATAPSGSHSLSNPVSHAVPGKSSRLDIMKECLFPHE